MSVIADILNWTKEVFLPLGPTGLFILSFIESSFFPIPPDVLFIPLSMLSPENALFYALIVTVGSVLGGIFGYFIGYSGGHYILEKLFSKKKIEKTHNLFQKYEAWAIFISAFTPIPYKVFTISAGVFYVDFKKFVLASIVGRGLRFFSEALLIMLFGKFIVNLLENYFDILSLIGILLMILMFISFKYYKNVKSTKTRF